MVFLIQATQNRDTLALQIKLSELILALEGARNELAAVEQVSNCKLEDIGEEILGRPPKAHQQQRTDESRNRGRSARHSTTTSNASGLPLRALKRST
jgi:low affinity Fe/Cu permease